MSLRMNKMKTEFWGNVSHELKTPLTVVSNYAQLARRHAERAEVRDEYTAEKMQLLTAEAKRMAVMVEQLLDIARIEEGGMSCHMTSNDAAGLIRDAMNAFDAALDHNGNSLILDLPDGLRPVLCDRERIRQVLLNLVSNAIRFTHDGTIAVSAKMEGNAVSVTVTDTGEGMSRETLDIVFGRYHTNPPSAEGNTTGTGLGLHITRLIVEAHGGKIAIESEEGKGTAVTFTLPGLGEEP